jgi:hypothetical protein
VLRALLYGLAILHLGPGIAFAVLAFGCDPSGPLLGAVCQGNTLAVFLGLTLVFWLLLGAGTAAMLLLRRRTDKGATASDG